MSQTVPNPGLLVLLGLDILEYSLATIWAPPEADIYVAMVFEMLASDEGFNLQSLVASTFSQGRIQRDG